MNIIQRGMLGLILYYTISLIMWRNNCKKGPADTKFGSYYTQNKIDKGAALKTKLREANLIGSKGTPSYFDWRRNGKVSPVKNQRNCGACWAFSVVANIESHRRIYLDKNQTLSEQFLIDCIKNSKGCATASLIETFATIVDSLGGVLLERDYFPYANEQRECRWRRIGDPVPIPVTGFKRVYPNEDVMLEYVYQYGPLSAAINSRSMESYKGGIDEPTDEACPPSELNHAILIVGYSSYVSQDTGKETPYWIIKNSWGTEWGDNGYYYLVRGRNACGIASDVSFSFVK